MIWLEGTVWLSELFSTILRQQRLSLENQIEISTRHLLTGKKKKKEGSSVPERSSRKEGTPGGALTHTLLSILFHPSDRKIEYVLLSQRRGGPRIANAVSVQGQTLSMSVVV